MAIRYELFNPDTFKGNPALVIANGLFKAVKLSSLKATAGICSAEEVDARQIKCGITFSDMNMWGLSYALCIEDTCVDKGFKVYGGPLYSPNSSVCLAAEHLGQMSSGEFKLVRISEQNVNQSQ